MRDTKILTLSYFLKEDLLEVQKDDKILKSKKILEDVNYHNEGDIEDNVNGEVNLNNDEENRNILDNVKVDNLDKEDISLDYVKDEVPSDHNDWKYNDVRGSDISYDDAIEGGKNGETTDKGQLDKNNKVFCFPLTCIMADICSCKSFISFSNNYFS